jgi:hypothetical protein
MPITVTIPTLGKPKKVKDAIISILTKEWPLSARKIYNRVRNMCLDVSYQAVHKTINELLNNRIILRKDKEYALNKDWIDDVKNFAVNLSKVYEGKITMTMHKAFEQGFGSFTFDNVYSFYLGITKIFKRLSHESKKYDGLVFAQVRHMYWALASSQKEYELLRDMFHSYKELYILCRNDTKADRIAFEFYKLLNRKTHSIFGINCADNSDMFAGGEYIIQVFFGEGMNRLLDKSYNEAETVGGMKKLYNLIFNKKTEINVVVMKNQKLSEQMRKNVLSYFKKIQ